MGGRAISEIAVSKETGAADAGGTAKSVGRQALWVGASVAPQKIVVRINFGRWALSLSSVIKRMKRTKIFRRAKHLPARSTRRNTRSIRRRVHGDRLSTVAPIKNGRTGMRGGSFVGDAGVPIADPTRQIHSARVGDDERSSAGHANDARRRRKSSPKKIKQSGRRRRPQKLSGG